MISENQRQINKMTSWFTITATRRSRPRVVHPNNWRSCTLALTLCVLLTRAGLGELKQVRITGIHYPRIAIGARLEGTVTVETTIAPDGGVVDVKTTDKSLLANTAADSIRGWRFEPSRSTENRSARFTVEFRLIDECKLQCCYDQWIFEFPDHMIVTANTLPLNTSSFGSDKKSK